MVVWHDVGDRIYQDMATAQEQQARLRVLVAIAQADGDVQPKNQAYLERALKAIAPNSSLTLDQMLQEKPSLDSLLATITTPELQQRIYHDAVNLIEFDGITAAKQQLLERICATFNIPAASTNPAIVPEADPNQAIDQSSTFLADQSIIVGMRRIVEHSHQARRLVFDYAVGVAIVGLIPGGRLWPIQVLAIALLLIKMMRDIRFHWGFPKGPSLDVILGHLSRGMSALIMTGVAWLCLFILSLLLPSLRGLALAISAFTLAWSLGQMTNHMCLNRCQRDTDALEIIAMQQDGDRRQTKRWLSRQGIVSPWQQIRSWLNIRR
ncbi:MAG: DUF533 domain-containing protein [Cyanobacteria bacterium P01_A01_bin.37]